MKCQDLGFVQQKYAVLDAPPRPRKAPVQSAKRLLPRIGAALLEPVIEAPLLRRRAVAVIAVTAPNRESLLAALERLQAPWGPSFARGNAAAKYAKRVRQLIQPAL